MVKKILYIRWIQCKREIERLGALYVLLFFIIFVTACFILSALLNQYPNFILVDLTLVTIVFSIQLKRKDKKFLSMISSKPQLVFFTEYILLTSPVLLMILFSKNGFSLAGISLSYLLISTINYESSVKHLTINFSRFIPKENFEWIAGLRKFFWYFFPIYLFAFALLFLKFISLFLLWLLLGFIANFYQQSEPINLLRVNEQTPKEFLFKKIISHLKIYLIFSLPLVLAYVIIQEDIWIAMLFYCLSIINFILFILLKYSSYRPNLNLNSYTMFNTGLAHISVLIPFLLPIPLIICFREYKNAIINLKLYLDDHH